MTLELLGPYEDWSGALCARVDPELFFLESGPVPLDIRELCGNCPVRVRCLEYALANETADCQAWGIWGGLTPRERNELRRKRSA